MSKYFLKNFSQPPINNCNNRTRSKAVSYAFGREDEGTMLGDIEACLVYVHFVTYYNILLVRYFVFLKMSQDF